MFDEGNGDRDSHSTAIGDAMLTAQASSGFSRAAATLYLIWKNSLTRYVANGGTRDELKRVFDRLLAESNLNDDAGTGVEMSKDQSIIVPASLPNASGAGQRLRASSRQDIPSRAAGNSPSADRVQATIDARSKSATALLDSFKIRDGRPIGDVRFGELNELRLKNDVESRVLYQVMHHANAAHDAKVRDVIKDTELRRFIANAEKHAS